MKEKHVLFGISPFNSKFNENYLQRMLEWGFNNYNCVDILHPHEEAKYLLMGCGDDANKAKKKSRKEFFRAERVINGYLLQTKNTLSSKRILTFSDFYNNTSYQYFIEKFRHDYKENKEFYNLCVEQSYKAIIQRKKSINNYDSIAQHIYTRGATEYYLRRV